VSLPERPTGGRVYRARRRLRLSDMDAGGRLRLDAVARYLQDVASDDVLDAGWAPDEHVWVVRRTEISVVRSFRGDAEIDLATWCSGVGASAAARRTTLLGDGGGRVEAESVWIHLARDLRPARLPSRFHAVYTPSATGRGVSTKLELRGPADGVAVPWPLRVTDVDVLGHVNNAVYWSAVEGVLADRGAEPDDAVVEFRRPVDLGDEVELRVEARGRAIELAFDVAGSTRAAARMRVRYPRGSIQTARASPSSSAPA
jgi:acyl-ACP thioesterase